MPVTKVLTAGIGEVDMRGIDAYRQRGGYKQWERAVREMQPVERPKPGRTIRPPRTRGCRFPNRTQMVVSSEGQAAALPGLQL